MKQIVLFLCVLLAALVARSQADRTLTLGFWLEPHRSGPQDFISEIRDGPNGGRLDEKAKNSINAGVMGEWSMSQRTTLRMGLLYADRGYQTVWEPNSGSVSPSRVITRFRFSYLSIPLTLKHVLLRGRVRGYIAAGPVGDVFLHASNAPYNRTFKSFGLAYQISIGASCQVNRALDLHVEPVIRQGLTDYNDQRRYRPISAGVAFGLVVR